MSEVLRSLYSVMIELENLRAAGKDNKYYLASCKVFDAIQILENRPD